MSGLYPDAHLDTAQVSPSDAAVTLRSLARRYTSALVVPGEDAHPDDLFHRRPAPAQLSAIEHAVCAAGGLGALGVALRQALVEDDPAVEVPPLSAPPPVPGGGMEAADAVARVGDAGGALAEVIERTPGTEWSRPAHAGATRLSALDIVRGAVELSIHHLRAIERTIADVARGV